MKIRKLIISAKLEQINTQHQNIFIFHSSASASQWRFLKNFLFFYVTGARSSRWSDLSNKTSEFGALKEPTAGGASYKREDRPKPPRVTPVCLNGLQQKQTLLRGYTYFQSTSLKQNPVKDPFDISRLCRSGLTDRNVSAYCYDFSPMISTKKVKVVKSSSGTNLSHKCLAGPSHLYARRCVKHNSRKSTIHSGSLKTLSKTQQPLKNNFRPKGCLLFLNLNAGNRLPVISNMISESYQQNIQNEFELKHLDVVNKMLQTLEMNKNLTLLYGKINSTAVNHVDIKETFILDVQTTYQQLLISIYSLSVGFNFCLHQKIGEFFAIQESNRMDKRT